MKPDIRIPENWTPQQADLVFDFVERILQAIWDQYDNELSALYAAAYRDAAVARDYEDHDNQVDRYYSEDDDIPW